MPWPRRHGRLTGSFIDVEDGQSEGSVPYVNSEASDSEHTEEELATLNGGWGRASYCGYWKKRCDNDFSQQRYRCRLCRVLCCSESCLVEPNGVCEHCRKAWPNASWNFSQEEARLGFFGSSGSSGSAVDRIGNSLRPHSRQRSRSRSPASNLVGSCPICHERPRPCGHRVCMQCGLRCLPICPQLMPGNLHPVYQGVGLMS